MDTQKFSISLSQRQCEFIENYQTKHHHKSRSAVIKKALHALQYMELEAYYLEANQEIDHIFDATASDGIEDGER